MCAQTCQTVLYMFYVCGRYAIPIILTELRYKNSKVYTAYTISNIYFVLRSHSMSVNVYAANIVRIREIKAKLQSIIGNILS